MEFRQTLFVLFRFFVCLFFVFCGGGGGGGVASLFQAPAPAGVRGFNLPEAHSLYTARFYSSSFRRAVYLLVNPQSCLKWRRNNVSFDSLVS